jgi:hypothetical protein
MTIWAFFGVVNGFLYIPPLPLPRGAKPLSLNKGKGIKGIGLLKRG